MPEWHRRPTLISDRRDRLAHEIPQQTEHRRKCDRAALERARRANAEQLPHPQPQIERAGMHEQALPHVLVAAHVRPPEATGLIEMGTGSFQQFSPTAEQAVAADAADAPAIR